MKCTKLRGALVALCMAAGWAAPAQAQTLTGSWALEAEGPRGPQEITLTLVQDGTELTGTAEMEMRGPPGRGGGGGGRPGGPGPMTLEVVDGAVDGASFSFLLVLELNGNSIEMTYEGSVDGDEMTGTTSSGRGGPRSFTGTRAG